MVHVQQILYGYHLPNFVFTVNGLRTVHSYMHIAAFPCEHLPLSPTTILLVSSRIYSLSENSCSYFGQQHQQVDYSRRLFAFGACHFAASECPRVSASLPLLFDSKPQHKFAVQCLIDSPQRVSILHGIECPKFQHSQTFKFIAPSSRSDAPKRHRRALFEFTHLKFLAELADNPRKR